MLGCCCHLVSMLLQQLLLDAAGRVWVPDLVFFLAVAVATADQASCPSATAA
jgi:hypothetical protein